MSRFVGISMTPISYVASNSVCWVLAVPVMPDNFSYILK